MSDEVAQLETLIDSKRATNRLGLYQLIKVDQESLFKSFFEVPKRTSTIFHWINLNSKLNSIKIYLSKPVFHLNSEARKVTV